MSEFLVIRGVNYPIVPWMSKEAIESTLNYFPRDGDIIIASYPKTGTTWLHYLVLQITSKGEYFPAFNDVTSKTYMEMVGSEGIDNLKGLRIYKHHYRYDMIKKNPKSKVLYIYRKPEDTLVSFFHFRENFYQKKLELGDFFERFMTGNIECGSYFEHIMSFVEHKDDENLLLISYEKLHANPKEGILRIAEFLGKDYYQDLITDETLLKKVIHNTSFDSMKQSLKYEPFSSKHKDCSEKSGRVINLFRKGVVGDGRNLLSEEHMKQLYEKSAQALKGTDILTEWLIE